jgi:hypothetical protein
LAVSQNSVSGNESSKESKILPCKWPLNLSILGSLLVLAFYFIFLLPFFFYKNWFKLNSSARLWHMFLIASTY